MVDLVSVAISTFNAAPYLREALDSVLIQASDELELEVIVVDDESTDETPEIVKAYGDRIRFLQISHCGRPGSVRNHGLRAARSDYVAFLDADDVCLPGRIQQQLALIKSTESDLAVCDCLEFSSGNPARRSFLERIGAKTLLEASLRDSVVRNAFEVMLKIGGFIPPSAAMARRKTLLGLGLFPVHLKCGEDLDLFLRLALLGRIAVDFTPLTLRRLHNGNISRDRWQVASDGVLVCENLEKLDAVIRHKHWASLVRLTKANWYREQGSLYFREGERLAARKDWAQSFRLAPSFLLGAYWMMSFMPAPWVKAFQVLKTRKVEGRRMATFTHYPKRLREQPAVQKNERVNDEKKGAPSVTVIIPTKNRLDDLGAAVVSILGQGALPQQLIIIDQSETDESQSHVEKILAAAPESVREKVKLTYVADPSISGLTVARNRAMELAQGDVWLFLDDDIILEPDYLQEILSVYVRHPDVSGVSGVVTNFRRPAVSFRLWSRLLENGPFHDDRQAIYWNAEHLRQADPIRVTRLGGGLMSFRAGAIRGIKFDERLSGVSDGEDVDFCARLGPNPILTITPRARLVHKSSPVGRDMGHWLRRNVRATNYLYRKNWNEGVRNRLCFAWLNVGYLLVVTWAVMRRFSVDPWHAFWNGIREAKAVCHPWKAANRKAMAR